MNFPGVPMGTRTPEQSRQATTKDCHISPEHEPTSSAKVGVFFVHRRNLWIDSTPVNDARPYGDMLTHERWHADFWKNFRGAAGVPGHFCTSSNERDWTKRSGRWRRARSIHLSRL